MQKLAKELRLLPAKVFGAATVYSMLSTAPRGAHVVRFCEDAPCHVTGGCVVFDAIRTVLEPGQTSADGHWTFETTSYLGVCSVVPVLMVDDDVYGNMTAERVAEILGAVR